ncbi:ECF transporter S component [uncultured Actinomyces sp.]|uniref:ECF transporter S component n=1 Tax=uncultured Actinomyces sp. TaxID=249061 RepID=UPI0026261F53|nr:ECF transporter S component [uncultured Actinomyces sp.]
MATTARSLSWRVIDIVTAAVLGVACGLIFAVWNQVGSAALEGLKAITPGLDGLATGIWLLGGTLGGYVIRKPGAALFVELVAATVSMGLGSQWAVETLYSGLAQGIGAEIVFALLAYRRFNVWVVAAAGALSFACEWALELFLYGHLDKGVLYNAIYLVCGALSGIVLAGVLAWALTNALAKTGALDRFASGRGARELVDSRSMNEASSASPRPVSSPDGRVPLGEGAGARVRARGWGWRHAGRKNAALSGVDLDIAPGERVLVLGPSGSGKSTLMGGLAGLLGGAEEGEATGTLTVDGVAPAQARGRVGLLMQDPEAQVVLARVGDDVAFGMENLGVPREEIWPRVEESLSAVGLDAPLDHSTTELSGGQKQRLALASILAMGPGLLLLDEPTANLDPSGVAEVRAAVEAVVERTGATVVVVEHRVDVWAPLVDRVIVVADGRIAADGPLREVLEQQGDALRERGIWLPGDDVAAEVGPAPEAAPASSEDAPIARVTDLTIGYDKASPVRSGIDLTLERGVSTCIVGANGAGKSTFALTLAGLLPPLEGTVEVETSDGTAGDPHEWSSKQLLGRMSMVFQEPEYQFLASTVAEELAIGPRAAGMSEEEIAPLVEEHMEALGLTKLARANPMTLSGGEKRRLSVATALISAPELLILDEPTFGQDRGTWLGLVRLLRAALARGVTLVSITHDPAFVAAMGQRVVDLGLVGIRGGGESRDSAESALASPRDEADSGCASRTSVGSESGDSADATIIGDATGADAPAGEVPASAATAGAARMCAPTSARAPRRGLLARTNPVARVLALLVATTPLLITIDPVSAGVALALELALVPLSGVSARSFSLKATPLALAAPLGALSMLLYASPGGHVYWSFGPAAISDHSMWLASGIGLRMCALVVPAIALLDCIDPTDMGDGLAQILHLPARPVLAALAGARMTSLMAADWKALERARRARGVGDASRIRSFLRGSFSLLVFALRRSGKLATTMEARGFGAAGARTWARPSRLRAADAALMAVAIAVPAIALTVSVMAGTFALVGR